VTASKGPLVQVFLETRRLVLRRFTMADVDNKAGLRLVRSFHAPWPYPIEGDEFGDVEYALDKAEWERQGQTG
jgi:hypothetical protein